MGGELVSDCPVWENIIKKIYLGLVFQRIKQMQNIYQVYSLSVSEKTHLLFPADAAV